MAEEWLTIVEIAKRLDLAENTARRYANLFGEYLRSRKFGRATKYHPDALNVLSTISQLYKDGMSTEEVRERLAEAFPQHIDAEDPEDESPQLPAMINPEIQKTLDNLAEYIKRQEAVNHTLVQELQEQRKFIEKSIKERDEKLMAALNILLEARKEAAAEQEKEQEKKPWWKWW